MTAPFCQAPEVALHVTADGYVEPCRPNTQVHYGVLGERSLLTLFNGTAASELRAALAQGDTGRGCQGCWIRDVPGGGAPSPARAFDHLVPLEDPAPLRLDLTLPAPSDAATLAWGVAVLDALDEVAPVVREVHLGGRDPFQSTVGRQLLEALAAWSRPPLTTCRTTAEALPGWVGPVLDRLPLAPTVSLVAVTPETAQPLAPTQDQDAVLENLPVLAAHCDRHGIEMTLRYLVRRETWHELALAVRLADDLGAVLSIEHVEAPERSSLRSLPAFALEDVVQALARQRPQLECHDSRNLEVLDDLQTALAVRAENLRGPDTTVRFAAHFPDTAPYGDEPMDIEGAHRMLGAVYGSADLVWCDGDDVIEDASPTFVGVARELCLGWTIDRAINEIDDILGVSGPSEVHLETAPAHLEWEIRYPTVPTTVVRAVTLPRSGRSRGRPATVTVAVTTHEPDIAARPHATPVVAGERMSHDA